MARYEDLDNCAGNHSRIGCNDDDRFHQDPDDCGVFQPVEWVDPANCTGSVDGVAIRICSEDAKQGGIKFISSKKKS